MTPKPTPAQIAAEFEQEIARAPRWAQCDRSLLQALIDDWRRLEERCQLMQDALVDVGIETYIKGKRGVG